MLIEHLVCVRGYCCCQVTITPVLSFAVQLGKKCTEEKTQVPNEWYTCSVLINRYVILAAGKKILHSSEWSHKVQNHPVMGSTVLNTILTHISEATPPFSSSAALKTRDQWPGAVAFTLLLRTHNKKCFTSLPSEHIYTYM